MQAHSELTAPQIGQPVISNLVTGHEDAVRRTEASHHLTECLKEDDIGVVARPWSIKRIAGEVEQQCRRTEHDTHTDTDGHPALIHLHGRQSSPAHQRPPNHPGGQD